MFTEREYQILCILFSQDDWIRGAELAGMLGISKRMLQLDIQAIGKAFERLKMPSGVKIVSCRKGYGIRDVDDTLRQLLLRQEDVFRAEAHSDQFGKRILAVLLYEKDYVNVKTLADRLYYSETAVAKELHNVKRALRKQKGSQLITSSKGVRVEMDESMKRVMCAKILEEEPGAVIYFPGMAELFEGLPELKELISKCLLRHRLVMTGSSFNSFLYYILLTVNRSVQGFELETVEADNEVGALCREMIQIVDVCMQYKISDDEARCLQRRMDEVPVIKSDYPPNPVQGDRIILEFISLIESKSGMNFRMTDSIQRHMAFHVERMLLRVQSGETVYGKYTREMYRLYPLETHLIKTYFSQIVHTYIPDSELGFLVMYLAELSEYNRPKLEIVLLSDKNGCVVYSLRSWLMDHLGQYIGSVRIIPIYLYKSGLADLGNANFFITTEYQHLLEDSKFFYLDFQDRKQQLERLEKQLRETLERKREKDLQAAAEYYRNFTKEVVYKGAAEDFLDILQYYQLSFLVLESSVVTVEDEVLCVVTHDMNQENMMYMIHIQDKLHFSNKNIKTMFYVRYHGGEDTHVFFEIVKWKLSKLCEKQK